MSRDSNNPPSGPLPPVEGETLDAYYQRIAAQPRKRSFLWRIKGWLGLAGVLFPVLGYCVNVGSQVKSKIDAIATKADVQAYVQTAIEQSELRATSIAARRVWEMARDKVTEIKVECANFPVRGQPRACAFLIPVVPEREWSVR